MIDEMSLQKKPLSTKAVSMLVQMRKLIFLRELLFS